MVSRFDRRLLLAGGAVAAVGFAGASALGGLGWDAMAGAGSTARANKSYSYIDAIRTCRTSTTPVRRRASRPTA